MRRHIVADTFAAYRDDAAPASSPAPTTTTRRSPTPRRRRGRNDSALERFAIHESAEGHASIVHRASGEMMHAGIDPGARSATRSTSSNRVSSSASREPSGGAAGRVGRRHGRRAQRDGGRSAPARRCDGAGATPLHVVSFEHDVASLRLALRHARQVSAPAPSRAEPRAALRRVAVGDRARSSGRSSRATSASTSPSAADAGRASSTDPFSAKTDTRCGRSSASSACSPTCGDARHRALHLLGVDGGPDRDAGAGFVVGRGAPTGAPPETTLAHDAGGGAPMPSRGGARPPRRGVARAAGGGATPSSRATSEHRARRVDQRRVEGVGAVSAARRAFRLTAADALRATVRRGGSVPCRACPAHRVRSPSAYSSQASSSPAPQRACARRLRPDLRR